MKPIQVAYLAGPITAENDFEEQLNLQAAWLAAAALYKAGYAVYSPHAQTYRMGGLISYDEFLAADFAVLRRCDLLVLLGNWRQSTGCRRELAAASRAELPVFEFIRETNGAVSLRPLLLSLAEARSLGLLLHPVKSAPEADVPLVDGIDDAELADGEPA